jgi:hypothetical protein
METEQYTFEQTMVIKEIIREVLNFLFKSENGNMGERARWEQSKILQGALSEETPS